MVKIKYFCISLQSRSDRQEHMTKVFDKLGISPIWWIVDKDPRGGVIGCFTSHLSIWNLCLSDDNSDYFCIFEDDIDGEKINFEDAISHLPDNYDVINLTPGILYKSRNLSHGFFEGQFIACAGYVIPKSRLKTVINYVERQHGRAVDTAMLGLNMVGKSVFEQIGSPSDIAARPSVESSRRLQNFILTFPILGRLYVHSMIWNRSNPIFNHKGDNK